MHRLSMPQYNDIRAHLEHSITMKDGTKPIYTIVPARGGTS